MSLRGNFSDYSIICPIGSGTFGQLFKAKHIQTGEFVALKVLRLHRSLEEGIPKNILREIHCLYRLQYSSQILEIYDYFVYHSSIILVFPYYPSDLYQLIGKLPIRIVGKSIITMIFLQILYGLWEIHWNSLIHRDLKPGNILIQRNGMIAIGDFGLARINTGEIPSAAAMGGEFAGEEGEKTGDSQPFPVAGSESSQAEEFLPPAVSSEAPIERIAFSHEVATRWYRSPELLFGSRYYNESIDIWSCGVLFAEFFNHGRPLFPGQSDIEQLYCVFSLLGTPTEEEWPEFHLLPDYGKIQFQPFGKQPFSTILSNFPSSNEEEEENDEENRRRREEFLPVLDLLEKMMTFRPENRITALEAIKHPFFHGNPLQSIILQEIQEKLSEHPSSSSSSSETIEIHEFPRSETISHSPIKEFLEHSPYCEEYRLFLQEYIIDRISSDPLSSGDSLLLNDIGKIIQNLLFFSHESSSMIMRNKEEKQLWLKELLRKRFQQGQAKQGEEGEEKGMAGAAAGSFPPLDAESFDRLFARAEEIQRESAKVGKKPRSDKQVDVISFE